MELSKVLEGFTVANTLVIKAQVQVIRYTYAICMSLPAVCLACQCAALSSHVRHQSGRKKATIFSASLTENRMNKVVEVDE